MVKLVKKTRAGSKVRRIHDDPQTPYHRALASESVSDEVKNRLKQPYATLNPVALKIQGPTAVALSSARRSGRSATACSTLAAWRVTRHGRARRGHLTAPYPIPYAEASRQQARRNNRNNWLDLSGLQPRQPLQSLQAL